MFLQEAEEESESLGTWLLLLNLFAFYVIFGNHFTAFGQFYIEWTEAFETTKARAGVIGSLGWAVSCYCGSCIAKNMSPLSM